MSPSISVVLMAFNETTTLDSITKEIITTLEGLEQEYEIVIVDDGSTDGTKKNAEDLVNEYGQLRLVPHATNLGLGGVYRTGFTQSRFDLVTFFPADGQFPASILLQFIPLMNTHDMVLGYFLDRDRSILSKLLSKAEKILYGLLFGRMPKFQGVFMFKRTMLNEIPLQSSGRGWAVVLEFIIKASRSNYKLVSVPTEIRPRIAGKSKVNNIRTILENLVQAIELRRYL